MQTSSLKTEKLFLDAQNAVPGKVLTCASSSGLGTWADASGGGGSPVTLASAGGDETLVYEASGPNLAIKGLTAASGVSLTAGLDDITIGATGTNITLASAGGDESLVFTGSGPNLAIKGLSAGDGIDLISSPNSEVQIVNTRPETTIENAVASPLGEDLVDTGTAPAYVVKQISAGVGVSLISDTTSITVNNENAGLVATNSLGNIIINNETDRVGSFGTSNPAVITSPGVNSIAIGSWSGCPETGSIVIGSGTNSNLSSGAKARSRSGIAIGSSVGTGNRGARTDLTLAGIAIGSACDHDLYGTLNGAFADGGIAIGSGSVASNRGDIVLGTNSSGNFVCGNNSSGSFVIGENCSATASGLIAYNQSAAISTFHVQSFVIAEGSGSQIQLSEKMIQAGLNFPDFSYTPELSLLGSGFVERLPTNISQYEQFRPIVGNWTLLPEEISPGNVVRLWNTNAFLNVSATLAGGTYYVPSTSADPAIFLPSAGALLAYFPTTCIGNTWNFTTTNITKFTSSNDYLNAGILRSPCFSVALTAGWTLYNSEIFDNFTPLPPPFPTQYYSVPSLRIEEGATDLWKIMCTSLSPPGFALIRLTDVTKTPVPITPTGGNLIFEIDEPLGTTMTVVEADTANTIFTQYAVGNVSYPQNIFGRPPISFLSSNEKLYYCLTTAPGKRPSKFFFTRKAE